jgi:hypothetical protein
MVEVENNDIIDKGLPMVNNHWRIRSWFLLSFHCHFRIQSAFPTSTGGDPMSLIGIINTDRSIEDKIRNEFENAVGEPFSLHYATTPAMVKEVLNYNLPEIVVINLTDEGLNFNEVFDQIKEDLWLHTFGIIALHNKEIIDEREAAEKLKDFNVLAFLDYTKIEKYLVDYARIIDANQQIIFQFDLADKLSGIISGSFIIGNDLAAIPVYTSLTLSTLFQHGFIDGGKRMSLHLESVLKKCR